MSLKKYRFQIKKEDKVVTFSFPNHAVLLHISQSTHFLDGEEPAGVSVFLGNDTSYRKGWKLRSNLTTDDRVEFTLYDSKERKQVSVWINTRDLIKDLIFGKERILEEEDYRIWG